MNFSVNVPQLAQELRLLNQIAPTKATITIHSNVLIQAEEDRIHLSATDGELALHTASRAQVLEPGAATVPVKRLLDICEQLPPDLPATFTASGPVLSISAGNFRTRLQTREVEEFPVLPTVPADSELLQVEGRLLLQLVERTRYAVNDKGISKYTLNGACLVLNEQVAAMVATDGKRLALATMPFAGAANQFIIPSKTLDVLDSVLDMGQVSFCVGENHLFFGSGHRVLTSRTIDGQFPAYNRIIPQDHQFTAQVSRTALAEAIRRVGLVADDSGAMHIDFNAGHLQLSARDADVGDAAEVVQAEFSGQDPIRVCCLGKNVLEFLEVASSQQINIQLQDSAQPLLLRDGDHHLAVIMLMRG